MNLALDLGTTTGFAVVSQNIINGNYEIKKSGSVNFKPTRFQSSDRRFVEFREFLKKQLPLKTIYFEEVRRHIGVDAAHCYGGFKATLTTFCEDHNISYQGVHVGTIKKHIFGKGNATKEQVIEAVKLRGHYPKDDNEADAIALGYYIISNL